jgi:hypothetical protein
MATLEAKLRASRALPGDAIDLCGALDEAAADLKHCAATAYDFNTLDRFIPDRALDAALAAAQRVIVAVEKYRGGRS